jgi:peptidoglycan/LPS O-acetylase OafA/YrhL
MWPRIVEVMLGCWLVISPFIFHHGPEDAFLWRNDLACGSMIITIALLCAWRPLQRIHLLNLAAALWLIGVGFVAVASPPPPAYQNHVVLGALLIIFGIIPTRSEDGPDSWREFEHHERQRPA